MGFTIEDMLTISKDKYEMNLVAGKDGWANSISWIMIIEDITILRSLKGKELAVTTGLGFDTEDKLLDFANRLLDCHAAGLMVNTGYYIEELPQSLIDFCNTNDLPLLTVPWKIFLADMIKDLSMHLFFQGVADEQIDKAIIHAIESPLDYDSYRKDLLPFFDLDGQFQIALFSTGNLGELDTVERRKLGYRLQIHLKNITHNGVFLYYDEAFILVTNDVPASIQDQLIEDMLHRAHRQLDDTIYTGIGSVVTDISQLSLSYHRAKNALSMAMRTAREKVRFDDMGIFRLLYSVNDQSLLDEMMDETLTPILNYDKKHGNDDYLNTLKLYLKYNGSIQAVAEEMYTHRNTVSYRIANIKKLLGTELSTEEEKLKYQIAIYISEMK